MKDAKNHIKHVQKKVIKSVKREESYVAPSKNEEKIVEYRRPKPILNKRKIA